MSTLVPTLGVTDRADRHGARVSFRPWWIWLLTALAFPPAGYLAYGVVGRVDSVTPAILGGLITGAGIGAAQWALLRRRGTGLSWVAATAAGLGVGLAAGAALVSYRTDFGSLALMGAISGVAVGLAQGATLGNSKRMLLWAGATAVLWTVGWAVTTVAGIDVDKQWMVFGITGALVFAFLQSFIVRAFVPDKPTTS
jgi:hypothetical protein